MKRWLSALLILAMLVTLTGCAGAKTPEEKEAVPGTESTEPASQKEVPADEPAEAPAGEKIVVAPPALGESVYGFALRELRDFPLVGAQVYFFEHERTWARTAGLLR